MLPFFRNTFIKKKNPFLFLDKRSVIFQKESYIFSSYILQKKTDIFRLSTERFYFHKKEFYSEETKFNNSVKVNKMTSVVPLAVAIDPVRIPIDDCKDVEKIKIELKDLEEVDNKNNQLLVFLVSSPDKDSNGIKLNSIPENHKLHSILKTELRERFNGKFGSSQVFCAFNENNECVNLAFVGCGDCVNFLETDVKRIINNFVYLLFDYKITGFSLVFEINVDKNLFRFFMENFFLEYVTDERFKSADKSNSISHLEHITVHIANSKTYEEELKKSRIYFNATYYACQLVAAPSNYCNPVSLANAAVELAQKVQLECKILELKEIEQLKMGAYLSVAKGSMYPPRFLHLTYKGKGTIKKKVALIGKGITFDSGGYNLKAAPGSMIDIMKYDMSGCAAVLGCAYCIGVIRPENIEVHFLSAVCENMLSSHAYRPGDILTASNGKTIEVGNTDAEGRLTLADALVYAEKLKVDYIVDIATLTGAMLYSLGTSCAGVFGNNDELIKKILVSGKVANEPLWWLPIINEYKTSLNSKYADMNNISTGNKAASIIATLFLREFVNNTAWAHLDIAAVSWNFKTRKPRGFGVRLLTEFLLSLN